MFSTLSNVVNLYNQKFGHLNKGNAEITFSRQDIAGIHSFNTKNSPGLKANEPNESVAHTTAGLPDLAGSNNKLEEVVATGYGMERKRSMAGAVTYMRGKELEAAQTVEQALQGRVAGLLVAQNSAMPGAASSIIIRGLSSLNGNRQPLFVLDGIRVSGNINDLISLNNIRDITVLRGVQASALYGPDASNGAIKINSKTALNYSNYNYYRSYRLRDMEDLPYMLEIKGADSLGMMELYHRLQQVHAGNSAFYFDMAQHFYQKGLKSEASEILMEAAECTKGKLQGLLAVAYVLESWNMFDKAIVVYEQLVRYNTANMGLRRDLAWVYYQAGDYQRAVDLFYESIAWEEAGTGSLSEKVNMLYEMNRVIALHRNSIDFLKIPAALVKELPSGLRIVLNSNNNNMGTMKVMEPGGLIAPGNKATSILYSNNHWYNANNITVYQTSEPKAGKYKVSINYYGYYETGNIPSFIRIKTFKNFGKKNQSIEIENVVMDNQYGEIEIGTVRYEEEEK